MSNTLELTGLFVCLGQLIAGLWFARGISTQAGTMVYIYILVFLLGWMGEALPPTENLFIPPTWENTLVDPLPTYFYPPPSPTISPSSPLNNNSHNPMKKV